MDALKLNKILKFSYENYYTITYRVVKSNLFSYLFKKIRIKKDVQEF